MKKAVKSLLLAVTALCMLFAVACDNGGSKPAPTPEKVTVEITGAVTSLAVGETKTLGVKITPVDETAAVVWSSTDETVASVTDNVLSAHKAGNVRITATLQGKDASDSFLLAVTSGGGLNPATAVEISGVPTQKLFSDDAPFPLTATLTAEGEGDCTDVVKWTSSDPSVLTVDHNGNVTPVGGGTATVRAAVVDNIGLYAEKEISILPASIKTAPAGGVVQTETFADGELKDNGTDTDKKWYEGALFNVGARTGSTSLGTVAKGTNGGLVWTPWCADNSNQRIMFKYNEYEDLDFTGGKRYVLRVVLRTPENFPDAGYVFVYGFKKEACDSYKIPNAGEDVTVKAHTVANATSDARKVIKGKNALNYVDYILDGTQSSEFWLAIHGASNSGASGLSAAITVESIQVIDMAIYNDLLFAEIGDLTETFESAEIQNVTGNTKIFDGNYFTFTTTTADAVNIATFTSPETSMYMGGNCLRWTTPRVYQKGLTPGNGTNITSNPPKMEIDYKNVDSTKAYHLRLPLFIEKTGYSAKNMRMELYYVPTGDYKEISLGTQTAGFDTTVGALFEADIPVGWSGKLVLRLYNDEVTENASNSKYYVFIDGISVAVIENEGQN